MKELSIEEKAKRYDELKVTAQELEHDGCFDKITLFDLFPELKKSEDEMMRQRIIQAIRLRADDMNEEWSDEIAWLEKQGETEYDKDMLGAIEYCKKNNRPLEKEHIAWLEKQGEQKPAWSEEDEKMIRALVSMCDVWATSHQFYPKENKEMEAVKTWLKSLKNRALPQPKQEWSEEDDLILETIIEHIIPDKPFIANGFTDEELVTWLKSLRPQNRWKPSDEQMRVLDLAIRCGINRGTTEETTLVSLFNDLKKLKIIKL